MLDTSRWVYECETVKTVETGESGGLWIGLSLVIGLAIPAALKHYLNVWPVWLSVCGGAMLLSFLIVFIIETRQTSGDRPYGERNMKTQLPCDPDLQEAVVRCSVCTGEKVAGFRNRQDGRFTEVMLLRTPEDEKRFMEIYGIPSLKKEY